MGSADIPVPRTSGRLADCPAGHSYRGPHTSRVGHVGLGSVPQKPCVAPAADSGAPQGVLHDPSQPDICLRAHSTDTDTRSFFLGCQAWAPSHRSRYPLPFERHPLPPPLPWGVLGRLGMGTWLLPNSRWLVFNRRVGRRVPPGSASSPSRGGDGDTWISGVGVQWSAPCLCHSCTRALSGRLRSAH